MGTTAEKLSYLNTTKAKIKYALNLGGANITDETFREYADEIKDRYLDFMNNGTQEVWDNWDKVNGTGTSLSLNNTEEAPMSLAYKGNTYQFTSNGTNLFNPAYVTTGATVSGNDITITTSGTSVVLGGSWASFSAPTIFTIPTGKKYLIPIINGEEVDAIRINLQGHYTGSEVMTSLSTDVSKVQGGYTLENPFEVTAIRVSAYGSTYSDLQGITFNFYVGPDNAYSPHGATPSPSLPSQVQVVSGDNSIEVVGKNLYNDTLRQGVTGFDTGLYNADVSNNRATSSANGWTLLKAGTYTINAKTSQNKTLQISSVTFDTNNSFYNISGVSGQWKVLPFTFYTPVDIKYKLNYRYSDNSNILVSEISEIQIERSSTATTYEEYKSASYPISLGVENLLNSNINKTTTNGITFTPIYNDDSTLKYIIANGTASANIYFTLGNVNVKANTSYLLSGCPANDGSNAYRLYAYMYDSNNTYINVAIDYGYGNGITFSNANLDHIQVGFTITSGKTVNNFKIYPMVELGTTKHSYTPYGRTPIELCKIGTYQDYIYKDSGKWYLHKEIGKYTFTGNETYTTWSANRIKIIGTPNNYKKVNESETTLAFCSHYKAIARANTGAVDNSIAFYSTTDSDTGSIITDSVNNTGALLQAFMTSNTPTLYYILATPTYETITDTTLIVQLEALKKSYEGQTNISQTNNDLPFELDVTALSNGTVSTLGFSLGNPLSSSQPEEEEPAEEPEVDSEESL